MIFVRKVSDRSVQSVVLLWKKTGRVEQKSRGGKKLSKYTTEQSSYLLTLQDENPGNTYIIRVYVFVKQLHAYMFALLNCLCSCYSQSTSNSNDAKIQ